MVTLSVYCTLSTSQEFLSTMPKFQTALSTVRTKTFENDTFARFDFS